MPLSDMKAFYRHLEEANDAELLKLRDKVLNAIKHDLTQEDSKAKAMALLNHIEDEIIARTWKK